MDKRSKTIVLSLILFTTGACSNIEFPVPDEVSEYVKDFELLYDLDTRFIEWKFGELYFPNEKVFTIGKCRNAVITLDKKIWEGLSTQKQKALIWHEIGHCVLHLNHNNDKMEDGCPVSIMNSHIVSDECMDEHNYFNDRML